MPSKRIYMVRGLQVLRQSLYAKHSRQVQRASTASLQTKISRTIHLVRLRRPLCQLQQEPI